MLVPRPPVARTTLTLATIPALSVLRSVFVALVLGNTVEETRDDTYDQVSYDALAQRVVDGYGFSFVVDW